MSMPEDAPVLISHAGPVAHIRLNRPRALNSLSLEMISLIASGLDSAAADDGVEIVVLDGAGERGFCAGGDIRALRESALGDGTAARAFWSAEYRVNAQIAGFAKPVVAIMDGIVMGGGIGLGGHASHRVGTETLAAAMPEVGIGFYPDVAGTWLLARAPGRIGEYLTLTGRTVGTADALLAGLVDRHVPRAEIPELITALSDGMAPDAAIAAFAAAAPDGGELAAAGKWINAACSADGVGEILSRLQARSEPEAGEAAELITTRSPTSLAVALRGLRQARAMSGIGQVLDQDFRVACRFLDTPDFREGIRAAVVDKDRNPQWSPAGVGGVGEADIEPYFASLGADELGLAITSR